MNTFGLLLSLLSCTAWNSVCVEALLSPQSLIPSSGQPQWFSPTRNTASRIVESVPLPPPAVSNINKNRCTVLLQSSANNQPQQKQQRNQKRKQFAQPAFAQQQQKEFSGSKKSYKNAPTNAPEKVATTAAAPTTTASSLSSSGTRTASFRSDSALGSLHLQRIKTAGRVGTKRFVDPCKVFIGNLDFNVTEVELKAWLSKQFGLPSAVLIHHIKVVRDWKTVTSKGYAFCVFTAPHHATVCIDKCDGLMWNGRRVTVKQGVKKPDEKEIYIRQQKMERKLLNAEERAIQAGLDEASDGGPASKVKRIPRDPLESALLRKLDPDLLDDEEQDGAQDEYYFEDAEDDDDDDDEGVDGIWLGDDQDIILFDEEKAKTALSLSSSSSSSSSSNADAGKGNDDETETQSMNREQRREAGKSNKRKKPQPKGFGIKEKSR